MENEERGRKQSEEGPSMTTDIDREDVIRRSTTRTDSTDQDATNDWIEEDISNTITDNSLIRAHINSREMDKSLIRA